MRVSINFSSLAKRYDLRVVFRAVSGQAVAGEVLLIVGPNGAGKSTLVAILCGLLRPSRGEVAYQLEAASGKSQIPREKWRRYIGVVAPAMNLYQELTALENLRFFAKVRGMTGYERRCQECLEVVGLEPGLPTLVKGLSTGMVQRLRIAQAMLHEPPVLFLDEPGSNLDPAGQAWLASYVSSVTGAGKTVVLATNDCTEMTWGDRRVALGE